MFTVYASGSKKEYTLGTNAVRTRQLRVALEEVTGNKSEPLLGMYDGVVEHSLRIPANGWQLEDIRKLCVEAYKQECIMVVDERRRCFFVSTDTDVAMALAGNEPAGFLRQYGEYMPGGVDGWSYDGRAYYIVSELA